MDSSSRTYGHNSPATPSVGYSPDIPLNAGMGAPGTMGYDYRGPSAGGQVELVPLNEGYGAEGVNLKEIGELIPPPQIRRVSSQIRNGFHLEVRDLLVWVEEKKSLFGKVVSPAKAIIKGVSTEFKPGTITAIIGPSGSGKTTILNYLAGRMNESLKFKTYSEYYLNSTLIENLNEFKNVTGYVLQEDLMETELTPRQTFEHYAKFRAHPNPKETANGIIDDLDLHRAADTIIGNEFKRGVSGGEKKRVNIGIELVSNPNLLFLDEPTTGLDSVTAFDIINQLFKLKKQGMTIVTVLHAPSNEILALFDKIVVLVSGELVYDGPPDHIGERLKHFNFELPRFENPVEYFMKIIDKDDIRIAMAKEKGVVIDEEVNEIYKKRISCMVELQKIETQKKIEISNNRVTKTTIDDLRKISAEKNKRRNFITQTFLLTKLFAYLFFKDTHNLVVKTVMLWAMKIIILLQYVQNRDIDTSTTVGKMDKSGMLYMLLSSYFFAGASSTLTLFLERKRIYVKDKNARLYSSFPFYISNQIFMLPFYFINMAISIVVMFFALNLNNDPGVNFLWFLFFFFVGGYMGGGSIGLMASILVDTIQEASSMNPILTLPMMITAGFFARVKDINEPLRALSNLSLLRFPLQGVLSTQFGDGFGQIPENAFFDFSPSTKWLNLIVTCILIFGYRFLFYFLFLFRYRERDAVVSKDPAILEKYLGHTARVSKPNSQDRNSISRGSKLKSLPGASLFNNLRKKEEAASLNQTPLETQTVFTNQSIVPTLPQAVNVPQNGNALG